MGVEPFLVASSLEGIIAQRLVRRLCLNCRRPTPIDEAVALELRLTPEQRATARIYTETGCDQCRQTGFRGRLGIFEILPVRDEIETLIVARAPSSAIKQKAVALGMKTLREDGWMKVLDGITTIGEVLRVTEETD